LPKAVILTLFYYLPARLEPTRLEPDIGWKWLTMKNAIAYSVLELIVTIKVYSMGKLLAFPLNVI
jgi:hypothetical protein